MERYETMERYKTMQTNENEWNDTKDGTRRTKDGNDTYKWMEEGHREEKRKEKKEQYQVGEQMKGPRELKRFRFKPYNQKPVDVDVDVEIWRPKRDD